MDEQLAVILENDFDHWVVSPDESNVVAWQDYGNRAIVFDTSTGIEIVTIEAEMDKWFWSPSGKELISHDYITTRIWDATTGEFLRAVEAMYDRPD
jgi:WD40 repeat protein